MSEEIAYIDTSAGIKLFVDEPESDTLRGRLLDWPDRLSSELFVAEATRVGQTVERAAEANAIIDAIGYLPVNSAVLAEAGYIAPPSLGIAQAIHVATALSLSARLGIFFAYDPSVLNAARLAGLPVASPT